VGAHTHSWTTHLPQTLVISSSPSQTVTTAGGGELNSAAIIKSIEYSIQNEMFMGDFKLLQLQGYDIIFGCDCI
jgi:hypothetical protein